MERKYFRWLGAAVGLLCVVAVTTANPARSAFLSTTSNSTDVFTSDSLDPPTGVSATGIGCADEIDLDWTATADTYATGHKVSRGSVSGGPYNLIANVTPRATVTYADTTVTADVTYYYVLTAYYASWESTETAEVSAVSEGSTSQIRYAGTAVSEGAWEMTWANPTNVTADDNSDASILGFDSDELVNRLRSSSYGFTIPGTATIKGIEVEVEIVDDSSGGGADVTDQEARLAKAGAPVGDDKSDGAAWPSTRTVRTYGSATDLWGTSWTPAEINASGFGFGHRSGTAGHGDNSKVDFHRITVYYCP